jgi:hypothetical protein
VCGTWLCDDVPQTTLRLIVSYCHYSDRWHGHACVETLNADGITDRHHCKRTEFGPFEEEEDVYSWLQWKLDTLLPTVARSSNVTP